MIPLANQAIEAFDLAGSIEHPGEHGRAREAAIRSFLAEILPPDFGIDTRFVIDCLGNISQQVDIVIYRKSRYPVLDVGGVKHFMVESVAAVFETKSDIRSEKLLTEALDNIASVKGLDRTGVGRNSILTPFQRLVDPNNTVDQIFGGIIAGTSLTVENCRAKLADWMEANPDRGRWPNTYVDIKSFQITYFHRVEGQMVYRSVNAMTGEGLLPGARLMRRWGFSPPLAFLAVDVLEFLQVVPEISFLLTSGLNAVQTAQSGYFYRTLIPIGDTHGLLFSDNPLAADGSQD